MTSFFNFARSDLFFSKQSKQQRLVSLPSVMKAFWNEKKRKENEKTTLPLHLIFQPDPGIPTEIFILSPTPTQPWKRGNANPNPRTWQRARTSTHGASSRRRGEQLARARGRSMGHVRWVVPVLLYFIRCFLFILLKLFFDWPERRRRTIKWIRSLQNLGKFHYSCWIGNDCRLLSLVKYG
jgi:hypothetical protein